MICQRKTGRPVSDQNHGPLLQQVKALFDKKFFTFGIEHRSGFIENQNWRIF